MKSVENLKMTIVGKSYWSNEGAYQSELTELRKLVPNYGEADTLHGEMIRCIDNLYYEYCNNGNLNAKEFEYAVETYSGINEEGDEEEYEEEYEYCTGVKEHYMEMLSFLERHLRCVMEDKVYVKDLFSDVIQIIVEVEYADDLAFTDERMNKYDSLTDAVVWFCLNTENVNL